MTKVKKNRCSFCKKLFCCEDCCNEHIEKKHPSPEKKNECSLCRKDWIAVKNFDDPKLLCHVVFNHLPLQCLICGTLFNNSQDLKALGICEGIHAKNEETKNSLYSLDEPSAINKTPSGHLATRTSDIATEGSYVLNSTTFISPPEFTRHTSTPMHVNVAGLKVNFVFKTPKSPSFSLKTPSTGNQTSAYLRRKLESNKENNSRSETDPTDCEGSSTDQTHYFSFSTSTGTDLTNRTPLRSILSNRSIMTNDSSSCISKSSINSEKKLFDAMQQNSTENIKIENIATTNVSTPQFGKETRQAQLKDSSKRVRFSDQFEVKEEIQTATSTCDVDVTDNEVFYEARQSLGEMTVASADNLSLSSALIDKENEKNVQREKDEIKDTNPKDDKGPQPQPKPAASPESKSTNEGSSSSTSRVVMMLVVEKNGSISTEDLMPLIDTSLKKLVSTTGEKSQKSEQNQKNDSMATSVVTVDSYASVSTVECYKTPDSTVDLSRVRHASPIPSNSPAAGGIFSTLAHAMKIAYKSLSDSLASRNVSREPVGHQSLSLLSAIPEAGLASTKALTNLASALVPRSNKRLRDSDETTSPSSPENSSPDSVNDVRSPVPKRPRGWYKIRAREPISRMRNNSSASALPRGLSSTTQYFQNGSLTVGDTVLSLPSRAHQSTQTEE